MDRKEEEGVAKRYRTLKGSRRKARTKARVFPSDDDACVRLRDCSLVPEARRVPCRRHRRPRLDAIYVVSFSFVFVAALARVPGRMRWLDVMDCGVKRQAACASWPRPDQRPSVDLFSVRKSGAGVQRRAAKNAGTDLGALTFRRVLRSRARATISTT